MKGKSVGKLLVLSSLAVFSLLACNPDKGDSSKNGTPIYACDANYNPYIYTYLPLKFFNNDIPYVNVKTYLDKFFVYPSGSSYTSMYSVNKNNDIYTFKNKFWNNNGQTNSVTFNCADNTINFVNYPAFVRTNYFASTPVDPVGTYANDKRFLKQTASYTIKSDVPAIDLDDYSIVSHNESDGLYLPLYTTRTLFTDNFYSFFYNGSALYLDVNKNYDNEGELIPNTFTRAVKKNLFTPSTTYMNYNYNQILLDFDLHYGMKNVTRTNRRDDKTTTYTDFRKQFVTDKDKLLKINSFDSTINSIFNNYLDDGGHTVYVSNSYYNDNEPSYKVGVDEWRYISNVYNSIESARAKKSINTFERYDFDTNGDVDFITFDSFDENISNQLSTFNQKISANKTKHVAIDLSMNGGGYVYVAEMFASWLTRGNSICNSRYVVNGATIAEGSVNYVYDLNKNGVADSGDYLPSDVTTVDLIISNASFSAANYLACQISKYIPSGVAVTLRGNRTGGGTCCVDSYAMTPLGSSTRISSSLQLCKDNNGTKEDNDAGVTPGSSYIFSKFTDYANHQTIASNINQGK